MAIISPLFEEELPERINREKVKAFLDKYEKELRAEDFKAIVNKIEESGYRGDEDFRVLLGICEEILDINILDSIDFIPSKLYQGDKSVKKIVIPGNITKINTAAFKGCSNLESVEMPDSVEQIGDSLFADCEKLNNLKLSEKLSVIPNKAFAGCTSLKKVFIPDSVKRLGYDVFKDCPEDMVVELNRGVDRSEGPDDEHPKALKCKESTKNFVAKHLVWKNA